MRDPPALQLWTCMYNSAEGGVSRYVDGLRVAERLYAADETAYQFFSNVAMPYQCQDDGAILAASGPVFTHALQAGGDVLISPGNMTQIRYNDYDRMPIVSKCIEWWICCPAQLTALFLSFDQANIPAKFVPQFYEHHRLLADILSDPVRTSLQLANIFCDQ